MYTGTYALITHDVSWSGLFTLLGMWEHTALCTGCVARAFLFRFGISDVCCWLPLRFRYLQGMPGGERLSLPKLATAPKDYLKVTKPCIPKDTRYFSPAGPVAQFDTDFKHTSRTTKFERDALTYSPHYHHSKLDHVLERDAQDAHEFKGTFGDMQHCPSVA